MCRAIWRRNVGFLLMLGASVATVPVVQAQTSTEARQTESAHVSAVQTLVTANRSVAVRLQSGQTLVLDGAQGRVEIQVPDHAPLVFALGGPRYGASAVALPDGRVLIWGGVDSHGNYCPQGYWYSPTNESLRPTVRTGIPLMAGQRMLVLTDGFVMVAGGWQAGAPAPASGQWDVVSRRFEPLSTAPTFALRAPRLMNNGSAVFTLNRDSVGQGGSAYASYDPQARMWSLWSPTDPRLQDAVTLQVAGTFPASGAVGVAPDTNIGVRFSRPVSPATLSGKTLSLLGPGGFVNVEIHLVDEGRLAFLVPASDLYPDSHYTVFVQGVATPHGRAIAFTSFTFTTAALDALAGPSTSVSGSAGTFTGVPSSSGLPVVQIQASASAVQASADLAATARILPTTAPPPPVYLATGTDAQAKPAAMAPPLGCPAGLAGRPQLCRAHGAFQHGAWQPGLNNMGNLRLGGRWRINQPLRTPADIAAIAVARAVRAGHGPGGLTGTVRSITGQPVAGVILSIGPHTATTDAQGRFSLSDLPAGRQPLYVDGSTADRPGYRWGQFVVGVQVKSGVNMPLAYTMYLPRILPQDEVSIPSPTTRDMVITQPDMPGLQIRIPAGTVIKDHQGRVVTHLAIIPTPVDRAPFPVPVNFPVYFVIEPGGAVVQNLNANAPAGLQIDYPNYIGAKSGAKLNFLNYQPQTGWKVYGTGRVSSDGKHIVPNSMASTIWAMGAGFSPPINQPPDNSQAKICGSCSGDPIDLWSGMLQEAKTDDFIRDIIPISLGRVFHIDSQGSQKAFGGWRSNYQMWIDAASGVGNYSAITVVLPNGNGLEFNQVTTALNDEYTWTYSGSPSPWDGATLHATVGGSRCIDDSDCDLLILRDGTQFQFSGSGFLNYICDRFGNAVTLTNSAGLLSQVTSPSGRYIAFTYNSNNDVASATDSAGRTWTYSYTPTTSSSGTTINLLTQVTYPDGTTEKYAYQTDPSQSDWSKLLSITDRNGVTTVTNQYNATGQVTQQTLADGSAYKFAYTQNNGVPQETDVTDPSGMVRKVVFDPTSGYPTSDTDAAGTSYAQTWTYTRDSVGLIDSETDPLGRTTNYAYDSVGDITSLTGLAGTPQAVTYTMTYTPDYHQLASITDPLGHTTSLSYTSGCLTGITDALGHTTTITCDPSGQPTRITNALGDTTSFAYQGFDLHSITDPLGRTAVFTVDDVGRLVAVRDPAGNVWLRTYDSNDRVVQMTDPSGHQTDMVYDGDGHLTGVTLPNGGSIQYSYDARGWPVKRTDALAQASSWTYNAMGQVLSATDRKNQTTTLTRDLLGRPQLVTFADGSTQQYTFDAGNRLIQLVDSAAGTLTNTYDGLDDLTQQSSPAGAVSYTYDADQRRLTMTAGSQATVSYSYDAAGRLTGVSQGVEQVSMTYDAADRRLSLTLPNGVVTAYSYDAANDLTGLTYTNAGGTSLGTIAYTYNSAGLRSGQSGSLASDNLPTATTVTGTVDLDNRLIGWNGATDSYDADGNLISNGTDTYVWNARNQLVAIQQGGNTVASFNYDPLGRRASADLNGTTTGYLYDGWNAAQETRGGNATSILGGLAIDERFARTDVSGRTYFLTDALNSTVGLTDSSGALVEQYSYAPYGAVTASNSSFDNPFQYTGRENDGTGLDFYRARYYAPEMGRFISEDPMGFAGGQSNFYAYSYGNPVDFIDPTGRGPDLFEVGAGATIGGASAIATGYLNGESDANLMLDTGQGIVVGAFAGATSDYPLLEGMAARAAFAAAAEATKERISNGCTNGSAVGLAAAAAMIGDIQATNARFAIYNEDINSGLARSQIIASDAYGATFGAILQESYQMINSQETELPVNSDGLLWYTPGNK